MLSSPCDELEITASRASAHKLDTFHNTVSLRLLNVGLSVFCLGYVISCVLIEVKIASRAYIPDCKPMVLYYL